MQKNEQETKIRFSTRIFVFLWSHNCVFNRFGFVPMPGFLLETAHVVTSKHPQRNRIHVEPFLRLRVGETILVNERRLKISNSIKVYRRSLSCERFFFYLDQKISFYFVYFILEIFKKII